MNTDANPHVCGMSFDSTYQTISKIKVHNVSKNVFTAMKISA